VAQGDLDEVSKALYYWRLDLRGSGTICIGLGRDSCPLIQVTPGNLTNIKGTVQLLVMSILESNRSCHRALCVKGIEPLKPIVSHKKSETHVFKTLSKPLR